MKKSKLFKKGAASFYIVAFSTLILMILATSFAAVIISEVTRTSNDDLSQSAYDSAMAGVEDAKLAFYSYRNCAAQGYTKENGTEACKAIIEQMEEKNCDMVGEMLKREVNDAVQIQESSNVANNMQQAYTCVMISKDLPDYRADLNSSDSMDVIRPKFVEGITAADIGQIRINWYINNGEATEYAKINSGDYVQFNSGMSSETPTPPVLSLTVLQTGGADFAMSDFDTSVGDQTDRGMVYLVPTKQDSISGSDEGYIKAWDGTNNVIDKNGFVRSNDKTAKGSDGNATNRPYMVYCNEEGTAEFMCSALVNLPEPIGGARSDETFTVVVGMPYVSDSTEFSLEFYCKSGAVCGTEEGGSTPSNQATLSGVQIEIDSTGKANDLYRRVDVRLKPEDSSVLSILGPLELLDTENPGLVKDYRVGCEKNFISPGKEPNC